MYPLAWEGKGNLVMIFQNVHTFTDCLDVCKFTTFAESLICLRRSSPPSPGRPARPVTC